ncbi:lipid A biosynthesis acyltransferase [Syntrophus gentianae]|uniref:Lipid A biosynthesis acyltransferase n=1 Tax=Syntrophus gentianae TaxID=43775 RepID=A0A1H7YE89_9BACT|nr:lysophospholipid acyltransferase family protein [Syntrophus gentianae]SEM43499.1 lipid A biosynthesis acyltransferase [Syntrophus gentianae]
MKTLFYRMLIFLSRGMGLWFFRFFSWWVATGFFLFSPGRVAVSVRFYRALCPDRGKFSALKQAWRQYHSFTSVFLDRILLMEEGRLTHTSEGLEFLNEAMERKTGGILLMSHFGNWEVAARLLHRKGMRLLLYLGKKHKEQIESAQKKSLEEQGVRVVAVDEEGGSPLDIVEGIRFLKEGGLVSLTGDRLWGREQRTVSVSFLGHEAVLPEAPYLLALLSGAPLFIFLAFRIGEGRYAFFLSPPIYVKATSRREREPAIREAAQAYARLLEAAVRRHPQEWYHFEPFLGTRLSDG